MADLIQELEAELAEVEREQAAASEQIAPEPAPTLEPEPQSEAATSVEGEAHELAPTEPEHNLARALEQERRARRDTETTAEERRQEYERRMAALTDQFERIEQAQRQPAQPQENLPEHIKAGKPTVTWV